MENSELAYEKEVVPGISRHAIKILAEEGDNLEVATRMTKVLVACPLDAKCIHFITLYAMCLRLAALFCYIDFCETIEYIYIFLIDDNSETFRINGGAECAVECFRKHDKLKRETITFIAHFIDSKSATILTVSITSP